MKRFTDEDFTQNSLYLDALSRQYPTVRTATAEIINLSAILNLPKGTEHFISDIHGEHEAFRHILNNASGCIREKLDLLFKDILSSKDRAELATLIYYPSAKLKEIAQESDDLHERYRLILLNLVSIVRLVASKYTRSKVRKALTPEYAYILEELIMNDKDNQENRSSYHENILSSIIDLGQAENMIIDLATTIKRLIVDRLHIVGDVFDRGARPDIVLDDLINHHGVDIQWGNHDILWMGAACGSRACIANALNNSFSYGNLDTIEIGYGISLRPLSLFANEQYSDSDVSHYMPKGNTDGDFLKQDDDKLIARMHKAISIIQFKLEGQTILRNAEFQMDNRLLLDKIDPQKGTVTIDGKEYTLNNTDLPTVDWNNPYALNDGETRVMHYLKNAFMRSEKLQKHASFLFEKGEMYTIFNNNLLFHGCIPLDENGEFIKFNCANGLSGKAFMDYCDRMARQGYFAKDGTVERQQGKDFLWFLWCGKNSPLCAREKITTFERLFIDDEAAWIEPKNTYYNSWNDEKIADKILTEFSLGKNGSHIINGHIPIKSKKGEAPIKANGKLIVIDGGFCQAYQSTTGIGGYTLIYNAEGIRVSAHEPFKGRINAIRNNIDIISDTVVFEHADHKILVKDTDKGKELQRKIDDLTLLGQAFEQGIIKEKAIH